MLESVMGPASEYSRKCFVIASAQYVQGELGNHLGPVIPCFLPVMGRKLIEWQTESAPENYERYLSVPEDYVMSPWESRILEELNFSLIKLPVKTLKLSLCAILERLQEKLPDASIDLLYGDTMIPAIPVNRLAIAQDPKSYSWGYVLKNQEEPPLWIFAGRLHFESMQVLHETLLSSNDVMEAVNLLLERKQIEDYQVETWLDFGNLDTFYSSRRKIFTNRSFNNLELKGKEVTKASLNNPKKIIMEAQWLESVPKSTRAYFPSVLRVTQNSYTIPYIPDPSLDELLVHGKLKIHDWAIIFSELRTYFEYCIEAAKFSSKSVNPSFDLESIIFANALMRIENFPEELMGGMRTKGKVNKKQLLEFIQLSKKSITGSDIEGLTHGDLVFSNILWDKRKRQLTMIDPRGQTPQGELLLFGDLRYDLAKLYQSIFFDYDWIVAGRDLGQINSDTGDQFSNKEESFKSSLMNLFSTEILKPLGVREEDIEILASILLLNLIPLHSENLLRQKNFVERFKKHLNMRFQ